MSVKAAVVLIACLATPAAAQELSGPWTIVETRKAPWAEPNFPFVEGEEKALVGETVVFGPQSVTGPPLFGCSPATYETADTPPEGLFEGGLDGPGRGAKALAAELGMTTPTVRTTVTSCSEIAFHRISPNLILFGLDNRIYAMRPAK